MRFRAHLLIPAELPGIVHHVPNHPDLVAHSHEGFIELVLVLGGRARHRLPGSEAPITAGDLLVIPAEGRHGYAATDRLNLINLLLHPLRSAELLADLPHVAAAVAAAPFHRLRLLGPQRLADLARSLRGYAAAERMRATGWRTRCHGLLFTAMADLDEALATSAERDPLIAQVLARMEHTPDRRIPLAAFGIPERTLLRRFRAVTGTTPAAWHRQLRAGQAQNLRADGQSAAAAAAATGFCGTAHLARQRAPRG